MQLCANCEHNSNRTYSCVAKPVGFITPLLALQHRFNTSGARNVAVGPTAVLLVSEYNNTAVGPTAVLQNLQRKNET